MSARTPQAQQALDDLRRAGKLLSELAPAMTEFAAGMANVTKALAVASDGLEHVLRAAKKLDSRDALRDVLEEPVTVEHTHTGWGAYMDCPACQVIWGTG